jgi:hypothetical protein
VILPLDPDPGRPALSLFIVLAVTWAVMERRRREKDRT